MTKRITFLLDDLFFSTKLIPYIYSLIQNDAISLNRGKIIDIPNDNVNGSDLHAPPESSPVIMISLDISLSIIVLWFQL